MEMFANDRLAQAEQATKKWQGRALYALATCGPQDANRRQKSGRITPPLTSVNFDN